MATKNPEATIDFLLTCLECTEGKTDWEKVAVTTGWYKGGKFSRQAFTGIQKKYAGTYVGKANATNGDGGDKLKKPKSTTPKKRAASDGAVKGSGTGKKVKKEETPERENEDSDGFGNLDEVEAGDLED